MLTSHLPWHEYNMARSGNRLERRRGSFGGCDEQRWRWRGRGLCNKGRDRCGWAGGRAGVDTPFHVLPLSVTAAAMMSPVAGGRRHVVIVGISDPIRSSYFKSTSSYFKSTSSLPKYFQSTSEIFEVLWKYAVRTYVIIAKIMLVMCFADTSPKYV